MLFESRFNPVISFPTELKEWKYKIEDVSAKEGLTYFPVVFEMTNPETLYAIGSMGGFPSRYPHWSFGQEYDKMLKQHFFRVMKISEMVINTDPVYAYLMTTNSLIDQKMVMAHVYGHADFFKNNLWFTHTDRKMLNTMSNHAKLINKFIDRYGEQEVEDFLDVCFTIDNLIDKHSLFVTRKPKKLQGYRFDKDRKDEGNFRIDVDDEKFYMEDFINPRDFIKNKKEEFEKKIKDKEEQDSDLPEKDVLLFLIKRAPLKVWQRSILSIIREEAYYFAPQSMTKILNEGWASYWHSKLLLKNGIMNDSEIIDFAEHHSGTMGSSKMLNPYKLGYEIFLDIEERWNKGKFGKEWDECEDIHKKDNWDKKLNLGRKKIFQVRESCNDLMFIDEFFTRDLNQKLKLFSIDKNEYKEYYISNRDHLDIKERLLGHLTDFGHPPLTIIDADYNKNGTLLLEYNVNRDIMFNTKDTKEVIKNVQRLWKRNVELRVTTSDNEIIYENKGAETTEVVHPRSSLRRIL